MNTLVATDIYDPQIRLDPRSQSAQFLSQVLAGKWRVFDAAAGNGCDSAMLFRHGHSVMCNEINGEQLSDAKFVADEVGAQLAFTSYRWETMSDLLPREETFDGIIVTRNAFAMAEPDEQRKALSSFVERLNDGGALIVDERAYAYSGNDDNAFNPHPFAHGDLLRTLKEYNKPVDVYVDYKLHIMDAIEMPVVLSEASLFTYVLRNV